MSNEKERNLKEREEKERDEEDKREAERISWELKHVRDELIEELDDLHDEFKDEIGDLIEESEDIKEDLKEDLEDLEAERKDLLGEIGDVRAELENLGENARERIYQAREKLEHLKEKIKEHEGRYGVNIKKKLEKARKKAAKRINISVDPEMSDEWRDWADGLGASVSELVRRSMKFVKNNIGDIAKLEEWGHKMEKMGEGIEKAVKDSGIEDLGKKIEKQIGKKKLKPQIKIAINHESNKERIKKRVNGLIKLHKSLPIEKLAQAIDKSNKEAENFVYELVADGIEGTLEEGVFKFTSSSEEVISKLNDLIDKM